MIAAEFSRYIVSPQGTVFDTKLNRYSKLFRSNGYVQCRMQSNSGRAIVMGLHTAVAMFNDPDYFEGCVVHHVDGDKTNNCVDNLRCMTRSAHTKMHADPSAMIRRNRTLGPHNKGKKMGEAFCAKCSESAKRRWAMVKR